MNVSFTHKAYVTSAVMKYSSWVIYILLLCFICHFWSLTDSQFAFVLWIKAARTFCLTSHFLFCERIDADLCVYYVYMWFLLIFLLIYLFRLSINVAISVCALFWTSLVVCVFFSFFCFLLFVLSVRCCVIHMSYTLWNKPFCTLAVSRRGRETDESAGTLLLSVFLCCVVC